jgi:hypothetical protein
MMLSYNLAIDAPSVGMKAAKLKKPRCGEKEG